MCPLISCKGCWESESLASTKASYQHVYGKKFSKHEDQILGSEMIPNAHTDGSFVLGLLVDATIIYILYVLVMFGLVSQ